MRTVTRYRIGVAVALVVGLAVGGWLAAVFGSTNPDPPGRKPASHDVEHAEPVLFEADRGFPTVETVLRSAADVTQFAGRFSDAGDDLPRKIENALSERDFGNEALIAFSWGAGCLPGDGAKLTSSGGVDYSARLTGADDPPPECYAPWDILAVFALPKADVPPDTRLGGLAPDPPGPAELVHFTGIAGAAPRGMEVSQPDQLAAFGSGLDPAVTAGIRSEVQRSVDDRSFAFVLTGCHNDGAYLVISRDRLRPVLTATEPVVCVAPDYYVAVFTVPAASVPPMAVIG
ncbi:hypothetical protein ACIGO9_04985 [Nocardia asteroides]|uniref:hypothetical protein n=1 Tax=Nocardia asteroides TaxID=1824 RepID=UPI0037C82D29